jgi:hypothetical protein
LKFQLESQFRLKLARESDGHKGVAGLPYKLMIVTINVLAKAVIDKYRTKPNADALLMC